MQVYHIGETPARTGFACPAQKIWVEPPGGSCGSLKNMLYYSLLMRHRQAVRQGTLTPPSQVRLLLAQLCKKTCTEAELQPPVQVFLCAETGTGDGIGTVPPRKAFGRRSILLHLSEQKPLSLPSACGRYEIYHLKCFSYPMFILSQRFTFVKNFPISQILAITLFIYGHEGDN